MAVPRQATVPVQTRANTEGAGKGRKGQQLELAEGTMSQEAHGQGGVGRAEQGQTKRQCTHHLARGNWRVASLCASTGPGGWDDGRGCYAVDCSVVRGCPWWPVIRGPRSVTVSTGRSGARAQPRGARYDASAHGD